MHRTWARLLALLRSDRLDRDFDDEAAAHVALATDDYVRRGFSVAEATRLALADFGSFHAAKDGHRNARGLPWIDGVLLDARLALRGLVRDRWFTVAAIAMLGLALGLNAAVFTVTDAMVSRGFPHVRDNGRLLYIQERDAAGRGTIAYADFEDWRAQTRAFEGLSYVGTYNPIALRTADGRSMDLNVIRVSANTFHLLGVRPLLGRDFAQADAEPVASQVVILNHRFWMAQFGGRPEVIGSDVTINGAPATIVGVMPEGFDFPMRESAWMPVQPGPELRRRGLTYGGFVAVGRLHAGVSRQQAAAELEAINRRLAQAYPITNTGLVPTVADHGEMMSGRDATRIWGALSTAAWFVLLIAAANVTHLVLMRTVGRWREFSTKLALGSGAARLARQVLIENLTLVAVAGALAWWLVPSTLRWWSVATESRYQILDYAFSGRSVAYLWCVAALMAVLVSLAPIAQVWHAGRASSLAPGARGTTPGPRSRRLTSVLLAGQMALAITLLSSAGLLVYSISSIVRADTGVLDPEALVVGSVRLPSATYTTPHAREAYYQRLSDGLRTVSGVHGSAIATTIPVRFAPPRAIQIEQHGVAPEDEPPVPFLAVDGSYFSVVGATVVAGRAFNGLDDASSLPTAVVNRSFAARYWPDQQAVGRRIRVVENGEPGPWRIVVGVVSNILHSDPLRQTFKPLIYIPFAQDTVPVTAWFLVRTTVPVAPTAAAVREAIQALDPDVALANVGSLADRLAFDRDAMDPAHSELGKHALVTPALAVIALVLAGGGLAAVMMHAVGQRRREIGIRVAIGATAADIRRLVVREGMQPVWLGMAGGVALSIVVARLLRSQLVGISPHDPANLAGAVLALAAVALFACQVPALRAARVDPAEALRHD